MQEEILKEAHKLADSFFRQVPVKDVDTSIEDQISVISGGANSTNPSGMISDQYNTVLSDEILFGDHISQTSSKFNESDLTIKQEGGTSMAKLVANRMIQNLNESFEAFNFEQFVVAKTHDGINKRKDQTIADKRPVRTRDIT
jgi:hypothetical protein